ncbi:unnamed protein product [Absidia cylindrospora]
MTSLSSRHDEFGQHPIKKPKNDGLQNSFYKVQIAPIILFTDDTSGNISKQYNLFESWSISGTTKSNSEYSFCWCRRWEGWIICHAYGSWNHARSEESRRWCVLMFSAYYDEIVLVIAPLMFITADNPRHSQLCGIFGMTSTYPCRKCYQQNYRSTRRKRNVPAIEQLTNEQEFKYKDTEAEALLELESFDPPLDTQVEVLHTILLGITKYLVD